MAAKNFFTKEQQHAIVNAIVEAEKCTSGEIRVHIESLCDEDVLDRAAFLFKKLEMHKTELRNGALIYLATDDRKFAILGDAGLNAKVPEGFWDSIKDHMVGLFQQGKFAEGLCEGIAMIGDKLKTYFPISPDDVNELPNDISFGS
jgi:uncharacterized membrane protein